MLAALEQTLKTVPMLATLGIRAEEVRHGHLVLRLPLQPALLNHSGALHSSAIFAVGELCAAVVIGTHPVLAPYTALQKSTKIKYYAPSLLDVTAHAEITREMLALVEQGMSGQSAGSSSSARSAQLDVPVKVFDGHGSDVAELVSRFVIRGR